MTRDEALIKIKKCMALSRSAEAHEAAAALRQAQKLMELHDLSETDVSLTDVHEEVAKSPMTGLSQWQVELCVKIAEAFCCEYFTSLREGWSDAGLWRRERRFVFIGIDAAPTLAAYAFDVLARQCAKARMAHIRKQPKGCKAITKTARGDEFARGWVISACALLHKLQPSEANETLLLEYMAAKHPDLGKVDLKDRTKGKRVDGHAHAGYQAGKGATLNNGVGARSHALLGG